MFKQKKVPKTILDCPEPILWHLLSTKRPHGSQGIQECMTHIEALATAIAQAVANTSLRAVAE